MKRITAAAVLILAIFAGTAFAADTFPSKPFEFLAPAGAGGGWDTTIRMVGKVLGEEKIIGALKAYKDGSRPSQTMQRFARGSHQDFADIAAYFASRN